MRVIGAHWLSDIMFRFDESNRRLYVILIFTSVLLHEQPIAFLAACLVPRPARASRSRVGCGHTGAVTYDNAVCSISVRLFRERKTNVFWHSSYALVNHAAATLLFSDDSFARGPNRTRFSA